MTIKKWLGNGLLSINESILFWKYPEQVQKELNKRGGGISYMVTTVTSVFENGKFTQDIDAIINTFPDSNNITNTSNETSSVAARDLENENARLRNRSTVLSSGPTPGQNSTTTNTGLIQDPPIDHSVTSTDPTPQPSDQTIDPGGFE